MNNLTITQSVNAFIVPRGFEPLPIVQPIEADTQPESSAWMQREYDRLEEKSKRVGLNASEADALDYYAQELAYEAGYVGREY